MLREALDQSFKLITPGIRHMNSDQDHEACHDQKRVMTAPDAIAAGSDYLVIGRPITRAPYPLQALQDINAQIVTLGD
jgi:orotidine-5'-phosphate decarboxylase